MSILEYLIALQTSGEPTQTNNTPAAGYVVLAITAVVLGLVVLIFIRVNARRSSKR
jgi:hypothetical protein